MPKNAEISPYTIHVIYNIPLIMGLIVSLFFSPLLPKYINKLFEGKYHGF